MEELHGFLESIVYSQPENGFTVARLKVPKQKELVTIVGVLPGVQPGETLRCQGSWKHHPQHGKQFEVASFEWKSPEDAVGIQKYLESGMVRGIGPIYAERIVKQFGTKTLEVIEHSPERLAEIPGIGEKRIEKIVQSWNEQRQIRTVMIFLRGHGVSPAYAQKIFKKYGEQSIQIVQENPYRLAKEIQGIGFKSADLIAEALGLEKQAPARLEAGLEHTLWMLAGEGHSCFPTAGLKTRAAEMLEVEETLLDAPLAMLAKSGLLVVEDETVWTKIFYSCEVGIAREMARLAYHPARLRTIDQERALTWVEELQRIQLAPEQREAVKAGVSQKLAIITGGPGTGKSTITKAILAITEKLSPKIWLAAPTGRAAKRMAEICRRKTFTIHSMLEMDFTSGGFKRGKQNPLECDLLVVDEASMIDTMLLYSLLKAVPSHARLLLIGDVDQLPSVGAGSVLKDLIDSGRLPVHRLKQIFRQAAHSRIIVNAHRIQEGQFPELSNGAESDFLFINCEDPAEIVAKIVRLVKEELPATHKLHPLEEIQVLSPMKRGPIGIEQLNQHLQKALNPAASLGKGSSRMGQTFYVGDKVMQIRNNYQKEVYNGDIGRVLCIDSVEGFLVVRFDEKEVEYDLHELDELVLAYAVSVHKYQGSECPCIVMPIHTSHYKLLKKNLLYTAVTRGKRRVILIGSKRAVALAIKSESGEELRQTGLKSFLEKELASREGDEQMTLQI